jgi:peptidylprolyl isomerase
MTRTSRLCLIVAVLGLALAGCSGSGASPGGDSAGDLPEIVFTDGKPAMTPVAGDPPAKLQVQVLTQGNGATVTADQTVTVNYAGWLWSDGTQFDSSYGAAPITFPLANLITGWQEGLTDQKVGSTVELVIPPDKGYGSQAVGSIPGNSTLVFVVEIVAAE